MKKRLIAAMVVALLLAGCCTRMDSATGKETKSLWNCLTAASDYVCNPPQDVKDTAMAALPVLTSILNGLVPATAAYINANNVAATADNLRQGLCVFTTDLNALIAELQSSDFQTAQAKLVATKAIPGPINVQAMINWQIMAKQHPKI